VLLTGVLLTGVLLTGVLLTNLTKETILIFNATPHFLVYSDTAVLQPAYNMQISNARGKKFRRLSSYSGSSIRPSVAIQKN
jgi:hypothetical protein